MSPLTHGARGSSRSRRALVVLPALLLGASALGCNDALPPPVPDASHPPAADAAAEMPSCPASTGPIDPTELIDNFESDTASIAQIGGRMGGWYAVGDATPTAIIQPSGDALPEAIPGERCGSRHGMRVTGNGFLDWGAEVVTPLRFGPDDAGVSNYLPYDGSEYQGVTFFARIGDTSSTQIRFAVSDERARPEAGICVVNGGTGTACYDTFGVDLSATLTTDWQEYRIPFLGLAQRNFGVHGDKVDTANMYDFEFTFAPNVIFDLWIDDISFY
jgi:hypothetical protein